MVSKHELTEGNLRRMEMASAYQELDAITAYHGPSPDQPSGGPGSFRDTARNFFSAIHTRASELIAQQNPNLAAVERQVEVFVGIPTAGKSWARRRYETIAGVFSDDILPTPLAFKTLLKGDAIKSVTWEKSKQRLRDEGRITTPRAKRSTPHDLLETNHELERDFVDAIASSLGVLGEIPVITEARIRGKWEGLEYGARVLRRLVKREGVFQDLPPYRVRIRGVVPGRLQRIFAGLYRDAMHSSKTLDEARELAGYFNQPAPENEEEWQELKKEGATKIQRRMLEDSTREIITRLWVAGKIDTLDNPDDKKEHDLIRLVTIEDIGLLPEDLFVGLNENKNLTSKEKLEEFLKRVDERRRKGGIK